MARAKLAGAIVPLDEVTRSRAAIVLAADTTVILDGRIFGKPENDDEAREMLRALSGAKHEVVTAFTLGDPKTGRLVSEQSVRTLVEFRVLDAAEIDAYVSTAEPRDKAGGYAIQGMASALVRRIDGSHTNVIGLPTAELVMELRRLELL
jgi:septum formation protein